MARRRNYNLCGHSTSVQGATDLVNLVKAVPGVRRVSNGRTNRVVRSDGFRGVKIVRNSYCVQITLFADTGTQRFSVMPIDDVDLLGLYRLILKKIKDKKKYRIWGEKDEEMSRKMMDLETDQFYAPIVRLLTENAKEENGILVIDGIRKLLYGYGLSRDEVKRVQANGRIVRSLRVPGETRRGNTRYQLLVTSQLESKDQPTKPEESCSNVETEEVRPEPEPCESKPVLELGSIPPEILKPALEALWADLERRIDLLDRERVALTKERDALRVRMGELVTEFQQRSEGIESLRVQISEVLSLLERLR